MDPIKALEMFDLAWKTYEKVATTGYILCGLGGFVIGMIVAMIIWTDGPKKKDNK